MWWLTPILPAVWETEVEALLEARSSIPAWVTWENPVSPNNREKLAGPGGVCAVLVIQEAYMRGSLKPRNLRIWTCNSYGGSTALQPGWKRKTLSLKNNNKTKGEIVLQCLEKKVSEESQEEEGLLFAVILIIMQWKIWSRLVQKGRGPGNLETKL